MARSRKCIKSSKHLPSTVKLRMRKGNGDGELVPCFCCKVLRNFTRDDDLITISFLLFLRSKRFMGYFFIYTNDIENVVRHTCKVKEALEVKVARASWMAPWKNSKSCGALACMAPMKREVRCG